MNRKHWAVGITLVLCLAAGGMAGIALYRPKQPAVTTDAWAQLPLYADQCNEAVIGTEEPTLVYTNNINELDFARLLIIPLIHYVAVPIGAPCGVTRSWSSGRYGWCSKPRLQGETASWCPLTNPDLLKDAPFWAKGNFYISPSGLLAAETVQKYGAARAVMEALADYLVMAFGRPETASTPDMLACYVGAFAEGLHKHSFVTREVVTGLRSHYPTHATLFDRGVANPRSCRAV